MLSAFADMERAVAPTAARQPILETADELLDQCRNGRRDAQQRLYERFHEAPYRLLVRTVGVDDADDVLQDVFLKTFRTLHQFDGRSSFASWLYRLTFNEAMQHLRKRRRGRWATLEGEILDRKTALHPELDDKELLEAALQQLEPELRVVFLLREVENLSYAEIAEAAQIAVGTVASRLSRARTLLKLFLVESGWTP